MFNEFLIVKLWKFNFKANIKSNKECPKNASLKAPKHNIPKWQHIRLGAGIEFKWIKHLTLLNICLQNYWKGNKRQSFASVSFLCIDVFHLGVRFLFRVDKSKFICVRPMLGAKEDEEAAAD